MGRIWLLNKELYDHTRNEVPYDRPLHALRNEDIRSRALLVVQVIGATAVREDERLRVLLVDELLPSLCGQNGWQVDVP